MKRTGDILSIQREEARFRKWASNQDPGKRSGEWECDYPDWPSIYEAVTGVLSREDAITHLGDRGVESILYLLARDNECEIVADALAKRPEVLAAFAHAALQTGESDAKWQIAHGLGKPRVPREDAEALLVEFAVDADEYVRRRALLALADIKSPRTEAFAQKAWDSGLEYQRIAALWALKACGSGLLADFIAAAMVDGREHLTRNARQIHDDGEMTR
ncbi:MAG: HEAT repeat domain-containing protein [Lysobacteraceae bacterium]